MNYGGWLSAACSWPKKTAREIIFASHSVLNAKRSRRCGLRRLRERQATGDPSYALPPEEVLYALAIRESGGTRSNVKLDHPLIPASLFGDAAPPVIITIRQKD